MSCCPTLSELIGAPRSSLDAPLARLPLDVTNMGILPFLDTSDAGAFRRARAGNRRFVEAKLTDRCDGVVGRVWRPSVFFKKQRDVKRCGICFESMEGMQVIRNGHEQCKEHKFHGSCLKKWLSTNNTCPYCRREMRDLQAVYASEELRLMVPIEFEEGGEEKLQELAACVEARRPSTGEPFVQIGFFSLDDYMAAFEYEEIFKKARALVVVDLVTPPALTFSGDFDSWIDNVRFRYHDVESLSYVRHEGTIIQGAAVDENLRGTYGVFFENLLAPKRLTQIKVLKLDVDIFKYELFNSTNFDNLQELHLTSDRMDARAFKKIAKQLKEGWLQDRQEELETIKFKNFTLNMVYWKPVLASLFAGEEGFFQHAYDLRYPRQPIAVFPLFLEYYQGRSMINLNARDSSNNPLLTRMVLEHSRHRNLNNFYRMTFYDQMVDALFNLDVILREDELDFGAVNSEGHTALMTSVLQEDWRMAETLISKQEMQPFLDTPDADGVTPYVHVAMKMLSGIQGNATALLAFLRLLGADINIEDNYGETLLMKSKSVRDFEKALILGANPNKQSSVKTQRFANIVQPGYTVVHYLVDQLSEDDTVLEKLKLLGHVVNMDGHVFNVDLNIQDEAGVTPLMLAAEHPADDEKVMPILDWLLSQEGVSLNSRNNAGFSAFDLAQSVGREQRALKLSGLDVLQLDGGEIDLAADDFDNLF